MAGWPGGHCLSSITSLRSSTGVSLHKPMLMDSQHLRLGMSEPLVEVHLPTPVILPPPLAQRDMAATALEIVNNTQAVNIAREKKIVQLLAVAARVIGIKVRYSSDCWRLILIREINPVS